MAVWRSVARGFAGGGFVAECGEGATVGGRVVGREGVGEVDAPSSVPLVSVVGRTIGLHPAPPLTDSPREPRLPVGRLESGGSHPDPPGMPVIGGIVKLPDPRASPTIVSTDPVEEIVALGTGPPCAAGEIVRLDVSGGDVWAERIALVSLC